MVKRVHMSNHWCLCSSVFLNSTMYIKTSIKAQCLKTGFLEALLWLWQWRYQIHSTHCDLGYFHKIFLLYFLTKAAMYIYSSLYFCKYIFSSGHFIMHPLKCSNRDLGSANLCVYCSHINPLYFPFLSGVDGIWLRQMLSDKAFRSTCLWRHQCSVLVLADCCIQILFFNCLIK